MDINSANKAETYELLYEIEAAIGRGVSPEDFMFAVIELWETAAREKMRGELRELNRIFKALKDK